MQVSTLTYSDVANALRYAFGRIGRAIRSGGRRMQRLEFEKRLVVARPEVEGRSTRKGEFKKIVAAIRAAGDFDVEKGKFVTTRNPKRNGTPYFPHVRSSRAERREAARSSKRLAKTVGSPVRNQPERSDGNGANAEAGLG